MAYSRAHAYRIGRAFCRVNGLLFTVRGSRPLQEWDTGILREVIASDGYGLLSLKAAGMEPQIIVDVGAHIGAFAGWAKAQWPNALVICIEALFENMLLLQSNTRDVENVQCHYGALLGTVPSHHVRLHSFRLNPVSPENTGSSRMALPGELYDEVVPALTLGEVLHQHRVDRIDLLKLDCEGAELDLLRAAADSGLLSCIGVIRGEWHGLPTRHAIERLLESTHRCTLTVARADPELGMFFAELRTD